MAPPPKAGRDKSRQNNGKSSARVGMDEIFGSSMSTATPRPKPQDPFGMGNFSIPVNGNSDSNSSDYHNLGLLDKKIMEMKVLVQIPRCNIARWNVVINGYIFSHAGRIQSRFIYKHRRFLAGKFRSFEKLICEFI